MTSWLVVTQKLACQCLPATFDLTKLWRQQASTSQLRIFFQLVDLKIVQSLKLEQLLLSFGWTSSTLYSLDIQTILTVKIIRNRGPLIASLYRIVFYFLLLAWNYNKILLKHEFELPAARTPLISVVMSELKELKPVGNALNCNFMANSLKTMWRGEWALAEKGLWRSRWGSRFHIPDRMCKLVWEQLWQIANFCCKTWQNDCLNSGLKKLHFN